LRTELLTGAAQLPPIRSLSPSPVVDTSLLQRIRCSPSSGCRLVSLWLTLLADFPRAQTTQKGDKALRVGYSNACQSRTDKGYGGSAYASLASPSLPG
jgi:hypothetical protein